MAVVYALAGMAALGFLVGGATPDGPVSSGSEVTGVHQDRGQVSDWEVIRPGGETSCSHGTEFSFQFHPGDPEKVVIWFGGGGMCWTGETCDLARNPYYIPAIDPTATPRPRGIFNLGREENPFRGWSMLVIPICTADLHMGAADVTYEVPATDSLPEGTVVIHHQGARNAQAALDWIYHRVEAPTDVFVSGASAGAPASAFYAYAIARRYPQARVSQLGDAGGVFPVSAMAEMLRTWGNPEVRPDLPEYDDPETNLLTFYIASGRNAPNLSVAMVDYHRDVALVETLGMLGVSGLPLIELLDDARAELDEALPSFRSFILPGGHHGVLSMPFFYTWTSDGIPIRDWVARMVSGDTVETVQCLECREAGARARIAILQELAAGAGDPGFKAICIGVDPPFSVDGTNRPQDGFLERIRVPGFELRRYGDCIDNPGPSDFRWSGTAEGAEEVFITVKYVDSMSATGAVIQGSLIADESTAEDYKCVLAMGADGRWGVEHCDLMGGFPSS